MELKGLTGVTQKAVPVAWFSSASQVSRLLRTNRALTTAGNNGAINVWIDDAGRYCADYQRYLKTEARWRGKQKTRLTEWLKVWMPKMKGL